MVLVHQIRIGPITCTFVCMFVVAWSGRLIVSLDGRVVTTQRSCVQTRRLLICQQPV